MTVQAHVRPTAHSDLHDAVFPYAIVPFDGMLSSALPSTNTGLGMRVPTIRRDVESLIASAEAMTTAASSMVDQYWATYLTSTDNGITYIFLSESSSEQVRRLRDEISRRTRLTRQQIARALGVDRRSLTSWANGSSVPGPDRLERLQFLSALVREIDAIKPGRATEVMLARRRGHDLLDLVADGRFADAQNWQNLSPGVPSVRVVTRSTGARRPPLYAAALEAYLNGQLHTPPRARTVREEGDYEQDLDQAESVFPDEPLSTRRGRYR